jgi:uncharacterized protein YndB with AHSA1/START domain
MTHFDATIEIEAPPDRIWTALRDIEHWSEWTPTIIGIRSLDPGPLAVGTRAVVRQPKLLPAQWQVTEIDEGREFTWITAGPGVLVTARHSIEAAAGISRVTLSLDFSGPLGAVFARLTRGLNTRYLALEAQGLKNHTESGARWQSPKTAPAGVSQ